MSPREWSDFIHQSTVDWGGSSQMGELPVAMIPVYGDLGDLIQSMVLTVTSGLVFEILPSLTCTVWPWASLLPLWRNRSLILDLCNVVSRLCLLLLESSVVSVLFLRLRGW